MTVQCVSRAAATSLPASSAISFGRSEEKASLLPDAKQQVGGDSLSQLYEMLAQQENVQSASDQNQVVQRQAERKQEIVQENKALAEEAKDADKGGHGFFGSIEKLCSDAIEDVSTLHAKDLVDDATGDVDKGMIHNSHFWGDLAKVAETAGEVAGIVAGSALTVASGGTAGVAVAIGVALSVSALADQQTHFLKAMGVNDKAAGWIDLGVGLAGAVVTCGATMNAPVTQGASSSAATLAKELNVTATILQSGSSGVTAATTIHQGIVDADAQDAQADSLSAQQAVAKSERVMQWLIDGLQQGKKSLDAAKSTVQSTIETQNSTSLALASFGKA